MVRSLRAIAWERTAGATPCAEKITTASSGTCSISSTKTAPRFSKASTTKLLCTICRRTYTGGPHSSRAFSTVAIALSTPAQKLLGNASSTRRPTADAAVMVPPSRDQPVGFIGRAAPATALAEVTVASSRACGRVAARARGSPTFVGQG